MDLGAMIEVAIGIIFVWIVLSLTTIQIQEWISSRLDKRAKDLEASIHEMLANPNLKAQFYDHPVIRGLTAKKRKKPSETPPRFYRWPIVRGFTKEKRKLPSYIPPQQFALAMFDIAMTAGTESSVIQQGILKLRDDLRDDQAMTVPEAVVEELNLLSEFARSAAATEAGTAITLRTREALQEHTQNFMAKLKENYRNKHPGKELHLDPQLQERLESGLRAALDEAAVRIQEIKQVVNKQPHLEAENGMLKLRHGIAALSVISPEVNQTLSALLLNVEDYAAKTEDQLARARGSVEEWFDDSMDRVSGAYKRYSQTLALVIGIIVALMLNVDSINLTLYLWRDPAVRQALAAQASTFQLPEEVSFQENPQEAMQSFRNQFSGLNLPVGWGVTKVVDNCHLFPVHETEQVFGILLPGGRTCITPPQASNQDNLLLKLIGIFITALAARQGAPFWFDMLKRVVNVRATGANPKEKEGK